MAEGRHQHLSDECSVLWNQLQCEVPPLHLLEGGLVHVDPVELVEAEPLLGIDLAVPTLMARSLTTFSSQLRVLRIVPVDAWGM